MAIYKGFVKQYKTKTCFCGRHCATQTSVEKATAVGGNLCQAIRPWQCLNFLPEPQGQAALRGVLPQVAGSRGSRVSAAARTRDGAAAGIGSPDAESVAERSAAFASAKAGSCLLSCIS